MPEAFTKERILSANTTSCVNTTKYMLEAFTRERILSPSPPAHVVGIRSGRRQFQENFRTVGVRVLLHLTRAELSGLDGKNAEILVNNHLIRSESYKKIFSVCFSEKTCFLSGD